MRNSLDDPVNGLERSYEAAQSDRGALFERHRARLFGIAYRMLGSIDDANDTVQDVYLRWHGADAALVRTPEAWLVAVTTRLAIDRARAAAVERKRYVGEWLPEPLATDAPSATDRRAEIASDLSMAFLVLLERLAPEERAAFLLRDVFEAEYEEIAIILDRSEAACRQVIHRARQRIRAERARFAVAERVKEQLVDRFIAALEANDQDAVLSLVSDGATWTSDGGGRVSSVRNVLRGASRIARLVLGLEKKGRGVMRHTKGWANGEPVMLTYALDRLYCTTSVATDGEQLLAFYRVMNPAKLGHAAR